MDDLSVLKTTPNVDCNGFTVYDIPNCDPYCWKTIWLACSIITSTVWLLLLNTKMLPKLRPLRNKKIFMSIIKKPYFWSLNTITVELYISAFKEKRLSSHFQRCLLFNYVCFCLGQSLQVFNRFKSGRLQVIHSGVWRNKANDHSRPHVNDYKCFPVPQLSSVFLAEAFSRR